MSAVTATHADRNLRKGQILEVVLAQLRPRAAAKSTRVIVQDLSRSRSQDSWTSAMLSCGKFLVLTVTGKSTRSQGFSGRRHSADLDFNGFLPSQLKLSSPAPSITVRWVSLSTAVHQD